MPGGCGPPAPRLPLPSGLSLTGPLPALRPASAPVTGARAGQPASASVCGPRRWTLWEQVAQRGGSCLLRPRAPRPESGSTQACQFLLGWEVAHSGCCPWGGQWPVAGEWCPPAVAQVGTLATFPEASGGAGGGPVPLAVLPGTPPRPRVMSGPSRGTTEGLRDAVCSGVTGPIPGSVASAARCVPGLWARRHPGL